MSGRYARSETSRIRSNYQRFLSHRMKPAMAPIVESAFSNFTKSLLIKVLLSIFIHKANSTISLQRYTLPVRCVYYITPLCEIDIFRALL